MALLAPVALVLAGCAVPTGAHGGPEGLDGTLTVYAAASLATAFDEMAAAFEAEHPAVAVTPVYDGSSTLVTQIQEGAPADVLASADEASMAKTGELALSPQVFASNTLVIVVPAGNPANVTTLPDMTAATTVLCAPEVPCGAASHALIEYSEVSMQPASFEQNVTAVLTKVAAGEADAGLVYATDVIGRDDVESFVPDGADLFVNRYPIAALQDAPNPVAAATFVEFVRSATGQAILAQRGFGAP